MNKIAFIDPQRRETLFLEASASLNISETIIEKDFWVCFILKLLFEDSKFKDLFVFRGGTSLSKCYSVIFRFSEDIDLTLNRVFLNINDDFLWGERNNSQQKNVNHEVRNKANSFIVDIFIPSLQETLQKIGLVDFKVSLDSDDRLGLSVLIHYPSSFSDGYIRPTIKLEMGALGEWVPSTQKVVSAYLYEFDSVPKEDHEFKVNVIEAKRTFFDKLTILHSEVSRLENQPDRYARHYYDAYMLSISCEYEKALKDIDLLFDVVKFKNKFYYSARAQYENILKGQLRLIPNSQAISIFKNDYLNMRKMLFGDIPSFESIIDRLRVVEKEVNAKIIEHLESKK